MAPLVTIVFAALAAVAAANDGSITCFNDYGCTIDQASGMYLALQSWQDHEIGFARGESRPIISNGGCMLLGANATEDTSSMAKDVASGLRDIVNVCGMSGTIRGTGFAGNNGAFPLLLVGFSETNKPTTTNKPTADPVPTTPPSTQATTAH